MAQLFVIVEMTRVPHFVIISTKTHFLIYTNIYNYTNVEDIYQYNPIFWRVLWTKLSDSQRKYLARYFEKVLKDFKIRHSQNVPLNVIKMSLGMFKLHIFLIELLVNDELLCGY